MLDVLRKLHFTDKEVTVYLTLLRSGPLSLRMLAQKAELNRGTAYNILKALIDRGIVSYYQQDKRQHFIAEHPEALLAEARRQESQMQGTVKELEEILPELQSLRDDATGKPTVKYYEGMKGVHNILEDVLTTLREKKEKQYYIYSAADIRSFLYECYPDFTDKRIKAGISVDVISTSPGGQLCGLDRRKWVQDTDLITHTYILIYADRVAYITRHSDSIVGVLMESESIAETQRYLFRQLWNSLP